MAGLHLPLISSCWGIACTGKSVVALSICESRWEMTKDSKPDASLESARVTRQVDAKLREECSASEGEFLLHSASVASCSAVWRFQEAFDSPSGRSKPKRSGERPIVENSKHLAPTPVAPAWSMLHCAGTKFWLVQIYYRPTLQNRSRHCICIFGAWQELQSLRSDTEAKNQPQELRESTSIAACAIAHRPWKQEWPRGCRSRE